MNYKSLIHRNLVHVEEVANNYEFMLVCRSKRVGTAWDTIQNFLRSFSNPEQCVLSTLGPHICQLRQISSRVILQSAGLSC